MPHLRNRTTTVVVILSLAAGAARAGLEIVSTVRELGSPAARESQHTMEMDGDKIRMTHDTGAGVPSNVDMIYRGDRDVIWHVMHDRGRYAEVSKKSLGDMQDKMNAAMQQMRAQLADMPPEQRAMVEQMMGGQGLAAPSKPEPSPVKVRMTGEREEVNGLSCAKYRSTARGPRSRKYGPRRGVPSG
jgi:hypothetical protein